MNGNLLFKSSVMWNLVANFPDKWKECYYMLKNNYVLHV